MPGAAASAGEPRRACRDGALSIGRPVLGYSYGDTMRRRKRRFVIPVVSRANGRDWPDVTRRRSTELPTRKARLVAAEAERTLSARAARRPGIHRRFRPSELPPARVTHVAERRQRRRRQGPQRRRGGGETSADQPGQAGGPLLERRMVG